MTAGRRTLLSPPQDSLRLEGTMKRAFGILAVVILATGCGKDSKPNGDGVAGAPAADETQSCIVAYLDQCGWRDIELVNIAACAQVPSESLIVGEAWAFTFTAHYTNLLGERQTSENWLAVISRVEGKSCVRNCFDSARHLVGGHRGDERGETANLIALPGDAPK